MSSAPKGSHTRLRKEYAEISKNPPPFIVASPLPSNLLEWHYCIYGLTDCPYEGGFYHGKLLFPDAYPFKPPGIMMITPNGRFEVNTRLCLSMSDFHPDQWNPAWSVESILKGLVSFMLENTPTAGSVSTTTARKRELALQSGEFNLKNKTFCELFPEMEEKIKAVPLQPVQQPKADVSSSQPPSSSHSALLNIAVLVALVVFMFIVRMVIDAKSEEEL